MYAIRSYYVHVRHGRYFRIRLLDIARSPLPDFSGIRQSQGAAAYDTWYWSSCRSCRRALCSDTPLYRSAEPHLHRWTLSIAWFRHTAWHERDWYENRVCQRVHWVPLLPLRQWAVKEVALQKNYQPKDRSLWAWAAALKHRITSYNVCYTKLLRLLPINTWAKQSFPSRNSSLYSLA